MLGSAAAGCSPHSLHSVLVMLRQVAEIMWTTVSGVDFDNMCGVPYTALPIATVMSLLHNRPMLMRRKEVRCAARRNDALHPAADLGSSIKCDLHLCRGVPPSNI